MAAAAAVFTAAGCGSTGMKEAASSAAEGGRIPVAVSFNAMKELTEAVGGDKVAVKTIIPDGTEPHDFEPKGQDLKTLTEAKVFIYNGRGMESWAEKAAKAANNQQLITVEAAKGTEPIKLSDAEEIEEHGEYDPHVWLSLSGAAKEAENIRDALIQASPENQAYFEENYAKFKGKIDELQTEYDEKFKGASSHTIVTGHAAFAYVCRDFGLTQKSVEDVFATGEPTPARLAELTDFCRANHVKVVFTEDMVSPKVSETLAREAGAKAETIFTMEGSENGKSYLERMESNLKEIYEALQ